MNRKFIAAPQMAGVLVLLPLILGLDSPWLAERFAWGQWTANLITFAYFGWMYREAKPQLRKLMIIGLFVATAGEVFFSLVVGMYEYRLQNIPWYVPPGHTIMYATIFYWIRSPWVREHRKQLNVGLYALAALISIASLILANDVYGFACFVLFTVIMLSTRESTPFFVAMYLLVVYLELLGTRIGNWYWHSYLLNRWPAIPSGNPPIGIAVFYFGFDIGCLGFYMLTNLDIRARYDRRKAFKKALRLQPAVQ